MIIMYASSTCGDRRTRPAVRGLVIRTRFLPHEARLGDSQAARDLVQLLRRRAPRNLAGDGAAVLVGEVGRPSPSGSPRRGQAPPRLDSVSQQDYLSWSSSARGGKPGAPRIEAGGRLVHDDQPVVARDGLAFRGAGAMPPRSRDLGLRRSQFTRSSSFGLEFLESAGASTPLPTR